MRGYSDDRTSAAWRSAVELCGDVSAIEGPLAGHHHETYVIPLGAGCAGRRGAPPGRWKSRAARPGLVRFDRRSFVSEEDVVRALHRRVRRVPELIEVDGKGLQRFIEGATLGQLHPADAAVPGHLVVQMVDVFRELASIRPRSVRLPRRGPAPEAVADGDSAAFLEGLISYMEEHVQAAHADEVGGLFRDLGVDDGATARLRRFVSGLGERPFCLVHGDLHRENLIVDARQELWVIDWELAMVGDPLYDLATHLHLMRYPAWQERTVARLWSAAVSGVRPGGARGWGRDLPLLLGFKRAQSVFTDIVRVALALRGGAADPVGLLRDAVRLREVLDRGAVPLGLDSVPSVPVVAAALGRWCRGYAAAS
ncbi:phosphotransferase [Streptomyces sp. NPDC059524]|uniref:phosphotransferase n=1 Tax=Streptomyces sp. NPDC059524 TaxID=3346856 RepID=UPI0036AD29CA